MNGNGTIEFTSTASTVLNGDGSQTATASRTSQNGTLLASSVTAISADRNTRTITSDTNGDGATDSVETVATQADGSVVDTVKQDATTTQISVVNADGSTTQTRSDLNATGTLRDRIVLTTSANGYAITGTIDLNGDGTVDETFSDQIVLAGDETRTETTRTAYDDGGLKAQSVQTTSANGLTVTENTDLNGDGTTDLTVVENTLSSGAETATISHFNAAGALARGTSSRRARMDA